MVLGAEIGWENELEASLSPQAVEEFSASMPLGYRVLFDPRTVRKHAAIALRRGAQLAHAEVWSLMRDPGSALCVVAEDRPGLLSAIAAVLVFHRIDVITALVFSRKVGAGREAIDLFWVRRATETDRAPIDAGEAASIGEVVSALLSGAVAIEHIAPLIADPPPAGAPPLLVVRFDGEEGNLAILLVEAPDRPGILFAITRELFIQGAQIVRSLVRTADGRIFNRFELTELNGGRLGPDRRGQVVCAVIAALTWDGANPSRA